LKLKHWRGSQAEMPPATAPMLVFEYQLAAIFCAKLAP